VGFATAFYRDAFGAPAAWLAGALLAVHSRAVEFSSDVQSDGLYFGLFGAAVWLAWRARERRSLACATACGVVSGLAYLTRPEGLGVALVLAGLAAGAWLVRDWRGREAFGIAASVLAAAAIVAAPYALAISQRGEGLALTHKKSVRAMAGLPATPTAVTPAPTTPRDATPSPQTPLVELVPARPDRGEDTFAVMRATTRTERAWAALRMVARTERSALRYGPFGLLAIGLYAARGRPRRRGVFVLALAAFYTAVLYALTIEVGYVSRRHALPPLLPLLGYAGLGALAIGARLARDRLAPGAIATALVLAVAAGEIASQWSPRRAEERAALSAAHWLRDRGASGSLVTDRMRLGYYAGMAYVPFVRADDAALRSFFDRALDPARGQAGARFVLLDDPEDVAAVQRAAGSRLRLVHQAEEGGRRAWVFERTDLPSP
jgi:hypothetical protein